MLALQMSFGSYEAGVIQTTPFPAQGPEERYALAQFARKAWSLTRAFKTIDETSCSFVLPAAFNERRGFDPARVALELSNLMADIDDLAFRLYGVSQKDRHVIEEGELSVTRVANELDDVEGGSDESDEVEPEYGLTDSGDDGLISWLVGVAFGRFDLRLATGARPIPPEPEPFDPLPVRSPGMWPESEKPPVRPPDILVDDPGHPQDLASHVMAVANAVKVAEPENLRSWLAREFFPVHIKMYSKSRRKAPIYWQLATPSARYSVWLYIHAFTRDTMYRVQNDYVVPKLMLEERRLETMRRERQERSTAAERRALADQETFVDELRSLLDEVKRVAPLWNPELDDGVVINFASLWRLVSHHRPWQRELKSAWDALCAGKYDWAHLAMHLWPERVIPKCATDRSLAIAHDLEDVFWEQSTDGSWAARRAPTQPVDKLIQDRTSPAVKDALQNLLNAPTAANGVGTRRRRAAAGVGNGGGR
ncbi:hypothetical protein [Spirillospora sp. NPDC047279]|uniref:hypothetical protein n=1 Tax=Spirillospora sp. NPDC047279 TaxID=3155478 RepID=UPI0033F7502A